MNCSFCEKPELVSNYEGGLTCERCARVDPQLSLSESETPRGHGALTVEGRQKYLPVFDELQERHNIPSKIVLLAQHFFLQIKQVYKTKSMHLIIFCCLYQSFKTHKKIISIKSMWKLFPIEFNLSLINKEYFKFKKNGFFGDTPIFSIADYINELTVSININLITNSIAHAISFFVAKYVDEHEIIGIISLVLAQNFQEYRYLNKDSGKLIEKCCDIVGIGERKVFLKYNNILKIIL